MNRRFLTGLLILVCLSLVIDKCYAWPEPPIIIIWDHRVHTTVGESVHVGVFAVVESGGPIDYWDWTKPSLLYFFSTPYEADYGSTARFYSYTTGRYTVYAKGTDYYGQWDSDWAYVYIFEMDLDINGVSDSDEYSIGGYVGLNNDDDNNEGTADKDESGTVTGEDDLVAISLSYEPSSLYPGYIELKLPYGNNIRVWTDSTKGNLVIPDGSHNYKRWWVGTQPSTLYVEGYYTGTTNLWLLYTPDGQVYPGSNYDLVKFTVVEVDLDISGVADADEESTGGFIALNDNDDNGNGTPDKDESGTVSGEGDLIGIHLDISPSLNTGEVKLEATAGSSKIKVWESSTKGTQVNLPKTWDLSSESLPSATWGVEGVSPSSSLRDVELTLSYIKDSSTIHSDKVKFTVIDVDWVENTGQTYGFDNYTDPFYPQKSVDASDTDTAKAEITGTALSSSVYFLRTTGTSVTVSPSQASSSPQIVTFTGVSEGFSVIWSKLNSLGPYGKNAAPIGVAAYGLDSYTLAIRVVHEDDDDEQEIQPGQSGSSATDICVSPGDNGKRDTIKGGDDVYSGENILVGANLKCDTTADDEDDESTDPYTAAELEDYLDDTVYNQAVVDWTVDKLSDKDVNFDLDRDGYIDVSSWTTAEMDVIINNCDPGGYDKVVFIVNNPNGPYGGCSYGGSSYAFIFPGSDEERTTAHELGHAAFSLPDLEWLEWPLISDNYNLMWHTSAYSGKRLRKDQWTTIQSKE